MLILYIYLFLLHNKTQIKPQEKTEISRIHILDLISVYQCNSIYRRMNRIADETEFSLFDIRIYLFFRVL